MAIFVASATTAVGFVGMMIVSYKGLRTIGNLAIAGTITSLIGSLLTLFIVLSLAEALNKKRIAKKQPKYLWVPTSFF